MFVYVSCVCRTLGGCLDDNSFCYTLEVSFYSFQANCNPSSNAIPYTEEACILCHTRASVNLIELITA